MKTMKKYGTVERKVAYVAKAKFKDFEYLFADFSQANHGLDRIHKPTILYLLPPSGILNFHYGVVKDKPDTMIWFLCPTHFDFGGKENDCLIEQMKRVAIKFVYELGESGLFEPIEGNLSYQVGYDLFDDNLTGICITPTLVEKEGMPICDGNPERAGWDKEK